MTISTVWRIGSIAQRTFRPRRSSSWKLFARWVSASARMTEVRPKNSSKGVMPLDQPRMRQRRIDGGATRFVRRGHRQTKRGVEAAVDSAERIFGRAGRGVAEQGGVERVEPVLEFQRHIPVA